MVDLDQVQSTVDLILDHYEQEDMLKDILDNLNSGAVCLTLEDRDYDVYVSTHTDLLAYAKEENSLIVYGNPDFDSDLVDALFWIVVTNPLGERHFIVTHGYVSTGEMA